MNKLLLVIYIAATSAGLLALKFGTKTGLPVSYNQGKLAFNLNSYVILGLGLWAISFLTYVYLIAKNDLGYIIPFAAAFVYLIIFLGSYFIFQETFSPTKIAGITLIVGGLVLLNLK